MPTGTNSNKRAEGPSVIFWSSQLDLCLEQATHGWTGFMVMTRRGGRVGVVCDTLKGQLKALAKMAVDLPCIVNLAQSQPRAELAIF